MAEHRHSNQTRQCMAMMASVTPLYITHVQIYIGHMLPMTFISSRKPEMSIFSLFSISSGIQHSDLV